MYTTREVAEKTGLSMQRVQQWARANGKIATLPRKKGGRPCMLEFTDDDIRAIEASRGMRGRRYH